MQTIRKNVRSELEIRVEDEVSALDSPQERKFGVDCGRARRAPYLYLALSGANSAVWVFLQGLGLKLERARWTVISSRLLLFREERFLARFNHFLANPARLRGFTRSNIRTKRCRTSVLVPLQNFFNKPIPAIAPALSVCLFVGVRLNQHQTLSCLFPSARISQIGGELSSISLLLRLLLENVLRHDSTVCGQFNMKFTFSISGAYVHAVIKRCVASI